MPAVVKMLPSQAEFRQELFARGVLLDTGVPGVVGQGPVFVRVRNGLDTLVTNIAAAESPLVVSFPPVMPRSLFTATSYLHSFPHLAGTVWSFEGTEADAVQQAEAADAGEDWSRYQRMTELAMVPAACHPVYPAVAGQGPVPEAGLTVDAGAALVFRHEPSGDPARLQSFRQRELVRIGSPQQVLDWRRHWLQQGQAMLEALGLAVTAETASDPFFGRGGKLMAASQKANALKFELLTDITAETPTAVASFNYHLDHFTGYHRIERVGGGPTHTACLGFGLERLTMALLSTHGFELGRWPGAARDALGL